MPTAVNWLWLKSLQITKKKKGEHQDMKKNHQSVEKRKKKYIENDQFYPLLAGLLNF